MTNKNHHHKRNGYALFYDIVIIALGIAVAVALSKLGVIDYAVSTLKGYTILACFLAGVFFTSVFTIGPASIAIVNISHHVPLPTLALVGALGAMCGDLILFYFIRDRFSKDLMDAIKPSTAKHVHKFFSFGIVKWLSPVVGALIIASPLPDELGISLLGMSRVRAVVLMPISFVMNFLGICAIVGFANLIS